jgi:hypothetical protein
MDGQERNPSGQLVLLHHRQAGQAIISHQTHGIARGSIRVNIDRQVNHDIGGLDTMEHNRLELVSMERGVETAVDLGGKDRSFP